MSRAAELAAFIGGGSTGKILQVQRTQFTGTNTISLTGLADTVFTDLTVNITPTATSSVFRLDAQIFGEHGLIANAWNHIFFFYRDTTKLGHDAAGDRANGVSMITQTYSQANQNAASTPECGMYSFFDSPSTTSQITYKVGIRARQDGNFFLNRTLEDNDDTYYERGVSFITATEISG